MTRGQALEFVQKHGVVLESAQGPVPSLAAAVARGPIRGSWWSHPKSHEIFRLTRAVRESPDVLVCRLVDGKVTYVHRRLWPSVVRASSRLPKKRLAHVRESHASSGRHVTKELAFPSWVPSSVWSEATRLSEAEALRELGEWLK